MGYSNEFEKRVHHGQKRLKEVGREFEALVSRMNLAGQITKEMGLWIAQDKIECQNEMRLVLEKHIRDEIVYLKEHQDDHKKIKIATI